MAGAVPHEPRHSTSRSVMRPSAVVSPAFTPSFFWRCAQIISDPVRQQETLVHSSTTCRPTGRVLNIT